MRLAQDTPQNRRDRFLDRSMCTLSQFSAAQVRSRSSCPERMAVEAAMAFADVIRSGQLDRLRTCAAENCDNVHIDLSKNRSRRFCGVSCANRTNVAAYRTRRARQLAGR